MKLTLRAALAADEASRWALYESALRPHIDTIWGWDLAWQQADFDKATFASNTMVVEVDGSFAGYLQIDRGDPADYLRMILLTPGCRGKGIGAALLAAALAASRARGRELGLRVFRTNTEARRFYEREGWQVSADQGDFVLMQAPPAGVPVRLTPLLDGAHLL